MYSQEDIESLMRKRLEVTTPEPVDAEVMAQLQQNPQLREPFKHLSQSQINRLRDPNRAPRKKAKNLTRDEKLRVRIIREHFPELTYMQLAQRTGYTPSQIQYALHGPLTPKKRAYYRKYRRNAQSDSPLRPQSSNPYHDSSSIQS